jgi:Tol biopolymer transport system component
MEWTRKDSKDVRDLSWYDWSIAKDISKDGQWILFEESSEPAGPDYATAIRKIDGSPPIRLGDGSAGTLSPDGQWAVSVYTGAPQHISLFPIGPGEARQIFLPELEHIENGEAHFLPDGKRIIVRGNLPGRPSRDFIVDLSEPKPRTRPIPNAEFVYCPSPDGKYVVGTLGQSLALFPVNGGSPVPLDLPASDYVLQWSSDNQALYLAQKNEIPLKIYRVELASRKTTFVRELTPADRAGVVAINPIIASSDASEFAYSYYQTLSSLYVIRGLH